MTSIDGASPAGYTTLLTQPEPLTGAINHVGIQTADFSAAVAWYQEFFGCTLNWHMDGGFAALSHRRLPGLVKLAEVGVADIRFHLFTRAGDATLPPPTDTNQFQHVCLRVATPDQLRQWRDRWCELYTSGRYVFAKPEPASEIDTDSQGMQSFYAYDINGLEFEFTYLPGRFDERD